jgi:hypothetical protein
VAPADDEATGQGARDGMTFEVMAWLAERRMVLYVPAI